MFFTQEGGNLRYLTEMRRTCSAAYTEGSAMHEGHLLRRFFYVFVYTLLSSFLKTAVATNTTKQKHWVTDFCPYRAMG